MTAYLVTFKLVVDEETEEDAIESARQLAAHPRMEPDSVEEI